MDKIWFESGLPQHFASWLDGIATPLGPADTTPDDPFTDVAEAGAILASGLKYTPEMMDRAPKAKVICRTGIGYDNVDVTAATGRGIMVCNAPDGPTISTAEHTIMLILATAKNLKHSERVLRHGGRNFYKNHIGIELHQKTLGLVGFGRIGRHVAKVALALGMRVQAYDPYIDPEDVDQMGVSYVRSMKQLLETSDFVSPHLPLTDETRKLMNSKRFAQMKSGAVFINAARGPIVDESALLEAIDSGHLFAAGLDVTDPEPAHPDTPLLHRENVIVTPHIASATPAGKDRIYEIALSQVLQVLKGERPPHLVNPEVWEKRRP